MINASNEVFPKTTEWKKVNIDLELNKEDSVVISTTQLMIGFTSIRPKIAAQELFETMVD